MNLSDLINYIPVVGQFKTGYEEGKREREISDFNTKVEMQKKLIELQNANKTLGDFYGVPTADEENKMAQQIMDNKKRWEEARAKFVGPLTQEDQLSEPSPFVSKRNTFQEEYGVSPDINLEQFKRLSEAKENMARAKYYESGGKTKEAKSKMAVAGGYASQAFIDENFPEYAGQDMPIEELKQRMIQKRAVMRNNELVPVYTQEQALGEGEIPRNAITFNPPEDQPLSAEATVKFTNAGSAIGYINEMLQFADNDPNIYKVAALPLEADRLASVGNENAQKFITKKNNLIDLLKRMRSGAAGNENEEALYSTIISDITRGKVASREALTDILNEFQRMQRDLKTGRRKNLQETPLNKGGNPEKTNTPLNIDEIKQRAKPLMKPGDDIRVDPKGRVAIVSPDGTIRRIK